MRELIEQLFVGQLLLLENARRAGDHEQKCSRGPHRTFSDWQIVNTFTLLRGLDR
jgi:hypothetical protein